MTKLITLADRIFVAGHRGMVGSSIIRALHKSGYGNPSFGGSILSASRDELNLLNFDEVKQWFIKHQPSVVVLAAAKVGGIYANSRFPTEFLLENLKIQNNVIEIAWHFGVRRLLFLGSSCIYPKFAQQPIKEDALLSGSLETTNESYAIAKIAGLKLCNALKKQHSFDAISLMPTNLYGPGDYYHPQNSHVVPALIRRFHDAFVQRIPTVKCWGSGTPLRDLLHVDDLAEACVFVLENWYPDSDELPLLNVGSGREISIFDLADCVSKVIGYTGTVQWDSSKPDGTPRKILDISRLLNLGWRPRIPLEHGIASTVAHFHEDLRMETLRQ